jgi:AraC-like DNA-binding protein
MAYRELEPHPALRPYVDRFWLRTPDEAVDPRRILPDGCIDILVSGSGKVSVVGTMTRAVQIDGPSVANVAAVRFRPGGATPFLRTHARHLTDRNATAADLGLRWLEPAPFSDAQGGAAALEQLLLRRLDGVRTPDALVAHAVRLLFGEAPPSVTELARRIGWSRQHLRRVFEEHVGVGPKELARVARLQRAVAEVQRGRVSLADAAARVGYFDQAHMARDFRALVGMTPLSVQAAGSSIFPIRSLFPEASLAHEAHAQSDRGQHRGRAPFLGRPARFPEDRRGA